MHLSSLDKMREFRSRYLEDMEDRPLSILDIGSMDVNGSYRGIFDDPAWRYTGVDMSPGRNVDVVLTNPYRWKEIAPRSVDVLVSGQAFEHIEYFWVTMLEVSRVLRSGGLACIIAPSGGFEHKFPVDCWRFYPDGFAALARFAQLEVLEASTQWEDMGYRDDSDTWHDSMLVCRKPRVSPLRSLKREFKWFAQRFVLNTTLP